MDMFSLTSVTDYIAVYAAVLSTLLLIWDVYKHKTRGARLALRANKNLQIHGGTAFQYDQDELWASVSVTNVGDLPITLTSFGVTIYTSTFNRWRGKAKGDKSYALLSPRVAVNLPVKLGPGDEWRPLVKQKVPNLPLDIGEELKTNVLVFEIWVANRKRPYTTRLK